MDFPNYVNRYSNLNMNRLSEKTLMSLYTTNLRFMYRIYNVRNFRDSEIISHGLHHFANFFDDDEAS